MQRCIKAYCATSVTTTTSRKTVLACCLFTLESACRRFRLLPLAAALALLAMPQASHAQTNYFWDPGALSALGTADGSGTWDITTANWYNSGAGQVWVNPVTPTTGNVNNAIFGNGGIFPYTVTLGAPIDLGLMTFQPTGAAGGYTINTSASDPLTIFTGITVNYGSGPVTIGSSSGTGVVFGAANTWTNNSVNLLTVSSNINDSTFGLTVAGSGNTLISGAFVGSGSGGLTMSGNGTLTLSGVNTFTGNTAINSGTLQITGSGSLGSGSYAGTISNNGSLVYSSSASQTLSGAISGTGGLTMSGVGTGTLILSNSANTYTGNTIVDAGTLSLTGSVGTLAAPTVATGSLTVGLGGTFSFANTSASQTFNGLSVLSGASSVVNTNAGATPTLTVGTITRSIGGTVDFGAASSSTNEIISNNGNTNGILGAWATQGGEATWAVAGTGVAITGLASGAYQANTSSSLGASTTGNTDMTGGSTTLAAGGTVNSIRFNNAAAVTIANSFGPVIVTSGGILETSNVGANANTISGGVLEGPGGSDLVVIQNNISAPLTISSQISNNISATGLTKSGTGTLILLGGSDNYTGATTVNAGTLELSLSAGANPFASPITVNPGGTFQLNATGPVGVASTTANVTLNGGTVSYTSTSPTNFYFDFTGASANVAAASTITIAPTGPNLTTGEGGLYFDGGLTGSAPLTVNATTNGFGLVLRNVNSTYSGTMTVNGTASPVAGKGSGLVIGEDPTLVSLPNANLTINGTLELGNEASGMGWAAGNSSGTTFTMNSLNGTGDVVANYATVSTRALSVGNNNGSGVFSGSIYNGDGDTLSFIKNGVGTQVLSGANFYSGSTTVNAGTLSLTGSIAGPGNSALVVAGGTFSYGGDAETQTMNGFTVSGTGSASTIDNASAGGILALGAFASRSTAATLAFNNGTTGTISTTATNDATGLFSEWATYGGTSYATVSGGILSAYSGATAATASNIGAAATNYSVASGSTLGTLSATSTGNTLQFLGPAASSLTPNTTGGLALNGILAADNGGATIASGGGSLLAGANKELVILGPGNLAIGASIANSTSGSSALTFGGSGTLTLTGANTYTGQSYLESGTTNISADSNFGGAGVTVSVLSSSTTTTAVTLATTVTALPAGFGVGSTMLGQTVTATGGSSGAYTVTLSGNANSTITSAESVSYLEPLNINNATLQSGTATLQETTGAAANRNIVLGALGGTFDVTGSSNLTIPGIISGTGTLTKIDSGTLTLNGLNSYTGGTIVDGGTLALGNGTRAGVISGALTINNGAVVNANVNWGLGYGGVNDSPGPSVNSISINGSTLNFTGTAGSGGTAATNITMTGGTISGQAFDWYRGNTDNPVLTTVASSTTSTISSGLNLRIDGTLTLNVAQGTAPGGVDLLVSGIIDDGAGGSGATITKTGLGTAVFSNSAELYTGTTTVNQGTLELSFNANPSTYESPTTVNSGGTLQLNSSTAVVGVTNTAATIRLNGGTVSYTSPSNLYFVLDGAVTVSAASTINIAPTGPIGAGSNGGLYFDAGGLLGSAPLTVNATTPGFGLVLRNANTTYSGNLTVNGFASTVPGSGSGLVVGISGTASSMPNANITVNGTLEMGNNAAGMGWAGGASTGLTFQMNALNGTGVVVSNEAATSTRTLSVGNNNGTGAFSGTIANGTNDVLSFIKAGTGTETLSGINTYTGTTTISGGTLQLIANTATSTALYSGVTPGPVVMSGGTLALQGNLSSSGTVLQTVGALSLSTGTFNTITLADAGSAMGTSLTATSFTVPSAGTVLYLNQTNAGTGELTLGTAATLAFAPWAIVSSGGVTGFGSINGTTHQLVLAAGSTPLTPGPNTSTTNYTTTPSDPSYTAGTLTMTAGGTLNSLFITSGSAAPGTLALGGQTISLATNTLGMMGSDNYTISGLGGLTATNVSTALTVSQFGTGTLAINSLINAGGTGGLTLNGSGIVALGAANTYTGATTIQAGTLRLGSGGSINSGNALTTAIGATFDLNGNNQTLGAITNNGTITSTTNGSGTPTLTFGNTTALAGVGNWTGLMNVTYSDSATTASTFSGAWTNTGNNSFATSAAGSLTLSGAMANGGTLSLGTTAGGAIAVSGAVSNLGSVTLSTGTVAGGSITISGPISSTGAVSAITSTGPITLSGAITNVGNLTLTSGAGAISLSGPVSNTGIFTLNSNGAANFSSGATINNIGNVVLNTNSSGTITLSGTIANVGNLAINENGTAAGTITLTGTVNNFGSIAIGGTAALTTTISGFIGSNVNGVTYSGAQSIEFTNPANAFTGGLTITAGNLGIIGLATGGTINTFGASSSPINLDASAGSGANLSPNAPGLTVTIPNPITTGGAPSSTNNVDQIEPQDATTFTGLITLGHDLKIIPLVGATTTFTGGVVGGSLANPVNLNLGGRSAGLDGPTTFQTGAINFVGAINNIDAVVGDADTSTTAITSNISNVLSINQTSASSPLSVTGGTLTVNPTGTALTMASGAVLFTFSDNVTGTGNFSVTNSSGTAFSLGANVGNTGTVTLNANAASGSVTVTGSIPNATGITLNATSAGIAVNGNITNIGNLTATATGGAITLGGSIVELGNIAFNSSGAAITASGTILGIGNISLNANSASNILLSGTSVNPIGTITNSGTGHGTATISGLIGSSVTSVTQNSSTSTLIIGAGNNVAGGYIGPTLINTGTLEISFNGSVAAPNGFASPITVSPGATLQFTPSATAQDNNTAAIVSLNGTTALPSVLTYNPSGSFFNVWWSPVLVNGPSTINVSAGAATPIASGLYLDGGLRGSAPVTVSAIGSPSPVALVLRSDGSTYSGILTVNGVISQALGAGSGLAIGITSTNPNMPNATIDLNGTMEMGNNASTIGWAGSNSTGLTFQIDALNGGGDILADFPTTQTPVPTRALSVGNDNGTGSFTGIITNGTNDVMSFVKNGTGSETFSGANGYTGSTTVNGGTLAITGSGVLASTSLTVGGATFSYGGTATTQSVGGFTANSGDATINDATAGTTLAMAAVTRSAAGVTVNFNNVASPGSITYTSVTGVAGNGLTNSLLGNGGGWATYGTGTAMQYATTVSGTSPYTISGLTGMPALTAALFVSATANYEYSVSGGTDSSIIAPATANTIHYTGAGGETIALGANNLTVNGMMNASSGSLTISGGGAGILRPGSTNELVLTGSQPITISSVVGNNGTTSGALTDSLVGSTLTLSGTSANTYTGWTFVNGGTLNINADNNLGTGTVSVLNSGVSTPTDVVTLSTSVTTLPPGLAAGSTILGQTVTATGGTSGAFTLTLSGFANQSITTNTPATYLEPLNLNNGTFQSGTAALQETTTTTDYRNVVLGGGGGTIDVSNGNTLTLPGVISGPGGLTQVDTGTLALTSQGNTYAGGTVLNNGTLAITSDSQLGAAPATLTFNGGTLSVSGTAGLGLGQSRLIQGNGSVAAFNTVNSGTTITVAGPINGTGGLTKTGPGTLILANNNTYTGATTISQGTLQLPSLPAGAIAVYNFAAGTVSGTTVTNLGTGGSAYNGTLLSAATFPGSGNSNAVVASTFQNPSAPSGYVMTTGATATQADGGFLGIGAIGGTGIPTTGGNYTFSAWFSGYMGAQGEYSTLVRGGDASPVGGNHMLLTNFQQLGYFNNSGDGSIGSGPVNFNGASTNMAAFAGSSAWNQLTVVGTSSGTSTYYINGVQVGVVQDSSPNGIVTIGNIYNGTQTFAQYLDNVYVYGSSLTAAQVMQLYAATANTASSSTLLPISSPVTIASGATLDLNGNSQTVASLAGVSGATVTSSATGATSIFTLAPASGSTTYSGLIQNGNGTVGLTLNGAVGTTQILTAANTFSGPTTVSGGTLDLQNQNAIQSSTLTMSGGSVVFDQSVVANAFTVGGLAGSGNLALENNASSPVAIALTVGGNNASTTYSGILSDGLLGGSLIKTGTGSLTLTGANIYTGVTTVSNGALYANNTSGSATGTNTVSLASGTTLGGSGSIVGTVNVASGGILAPHTISTGANTLTVGNLTAAGTTNFNFNVTSATASDVIAVTSNLSLGATNNLALSFPNLVFPVAPVATTYNIVNYGTESATNYAFTVTGPATYLYSVSDNLAGNYVLTTVVNTATWTGSGGTAWDTTHANWSDPAPNVSNLFANGQPVVFSDSAGSGNTTVVIQSGGVSPYSATFNNNLYTYNVSTSGTAGIAGTAGVTVNGPGTVNFNSQNTYSGGTFLNGGTLAITADNALGTAATSPATNLTFNGGTLAFAANNITLGVDRSVSILAGGATFNLANATNAIAGSISGTAGGNLTVNGATADTLRLTSTTNTYNGNTIINGGTLQAVAGGMPATTTLFIGGASGTPTFDLDAVSRQVVGLSDNGGFTNGTVTNSGAAATLTVAPTNNTTTTFTGTIQNGSPTDTVGLTVNGLGTQVLAGANTFSGATTVTAGTLNLSNALALQNSTLTMNGGSAVFDQSVGGNAFTIGGLAGAGGLSLQNNASLPSPVTLTVGGNNASTVYSGLSGSGSLVKTGTGTLTLSGPSTYAGTTTINQGTVQLVPGTSVTIANANFTTGTTAGNYTYNPTGAGWTFAGFAAVAANGSGFNVVGSPSGFAGAMEYTGTISQALSFTAAGTYSLSFLTEYRNAASGVNPYYVEVNGVIDTSFGSNGLVTPGSNSSFTPISGTISIPASGSYTLEFVGTDPGGTDRSSFITNVAISSAAGALPTTTPLSLASGATFNLAAVNQTVASLSGSAGTITNNTATSTSILTVTPSGSPTTFSGAIQNGSSNTGIVGLTINGPGTQILAGTSTYTGATTINNGTLRVTGALGSTAVAVGGAAASGTPTLTTGAGSIAGLVTIAGTGAGVAGTIVGTTGSTLTLNGGLTLASGSISDFNLTSGGVNNANALININTGTFTGGGDLVYILGSSIAAGNYELYSGTGPIPATDFQLMTSATSPLIYSLQNNVSANQLDLVVTGLLTWTGANGSGWDTMNANWATGVTPVASTYINGAQVTFADKNPISPGTNLVPNTSGTATVVVQSGGVLPNAVTFTNVGSANGDGGVDYVIQSAASGLGISGTTGITLMGTGNVTLQGQNTFSGPVNITAGQLILQSSNALGSTSLVTVGSNGALALSGGVSASAPLVINGAGLASSPAGALNSAIGSNTYSGPITIGSSNAATINSASGATLALTGGISIGGSNTLTITGAGTTTISNTAITGSGNLVGSGTLNLAVASPLFSGTTTVNSGSVRVTANGANGTGQVMVSSGGALGGAGSISGLVTVASGGILAPSVGQSLPAATTSNFTGGLNLNSGSVLDFNLSDIADNVTPSNQNDHIAVTGAVSLNGGIVNIAGSALEAGSYELISYTPTGSPPSAFGWTVNTQPAGYNFTFSTTSNQFDLNVTIGSSSSYWNSIASSGNWSNSANWFGGAYPNGAGQTATFGTGTSNSITSGTVSGAAISVNNDINPTVGGLVFNNNQGVAYTLSDGNITLDNSGSGAMVSVASGTLTPTILTSLTLADSSHSTTFNVASGSSLDLEGMISDSSMVTGQKIVLTGGGTLFMEGNNTYSGGTTIQNGTLSLLGAGVPGTGSLTFNPSSSGNTATVNVNENVGLNNLSETPGSAGSARLNVAPSTTLTLTQTASANFAGSVSLGSGGALVVQQNSGNTLTLSGTQTLGSSSSVTVNSGTLSLANSTAPTISGNPTVTVAAGATLQLAGLAAALSSSVNITTQGTGTSGDGALKLTGTTTQTVGVVSGNSLSVPGITSYAGNTTVGDGTNVANLTATQILQNTLTIGVGSTVTLAPSTPLPMVVAATSSTAPAASASPLTASGDATTDSTSDPLLAIQAAIASGSITSAAGQQMENRIAALESLATRDPALNVSLLESRILATLPSSSLWSSTGAGSSTPLEDSGSSLLALDGSTFGTTSASSSAAAAFAPSAGFSASPASVPEPSTLLLAALGGIGLAFAARRRVNRRSGIRQ